jgi:hypothetical protein
VLRDKSIRTPRVESDSEMMTVGLGGSLEDALRGDYHRAVLNQARTPVVRRSLELSLWRAGYTCAL